MANLNPFRLSEEEASRMMGDAEFYARVNFTSTSDRSAFLKVCRNLNVKTFSVYGEVVMDIFYTEQQNKSLFATVRMADLKGITLVKWGTRQEYLDKVERAAADWGKGVAGDVKIRKV